MTEDVIILVGFFLVMIGFICFIGWSATTAPPANVRCPDCASTTRRENQAQRALLLPDHEGHDPFQLSGDDGTSKFQRLPPEILDQVMDPLSPLSLRCLQMACRRFYHHAHHKTSLNAQGKFRLRCVLERDQSSFRRLICSSCRVHHDRSQFFPSELQKDPLQRRCKIFKPVLRVCPHSAFCFDAIQWRANNLLGRICSHASCSLGGSPVLRDSWSSFAIRKRHYLTMLSTLRWPDISEVKQLLDVYNVPICPHLTLGHGHVLEAYRPWEKVFENRCSYCDTRFQFRLFEICALDREMPGGKCLSVFVTRKIGMLYSPTDPMWLSQLCVVNEPDFSNYWFNSITFSQEDEVDKRKRIRGDMPCGDGASSRCGFKAQIKESEDILQQRTSDILVGMTLSHVLPYNSLGEFFSSFKDKILYKPLWHSPANGLRDGYFSNGYLESDEF